MRTQSRSAGALAVALALGCALCTLLATAASASTATAAPNEHVTWRPRTATPPPGTFPAIRRAAETWCGSGETASDRTPQGSLSPATIRVLYAVPSDRESRYAALANAIVTDVAAIDRWWVAQDPTRAPRWDLAPSETCTGIEALDLGSVRLPRPASAYLGEDGFVVLAGDLSATVPSTQKALVFFDGAYFNPDICGISYEAPTFGGRYGVASVALLSSCGGDVGAGGLVARVAAHELTHDLGAVEPGAPHRCPDSGHVCDLSTDLMYPYVDGGSTMANALLDPGRDDYYGHGGGWFDVQDSAWLAHLPRRAVTVATVGRGVVAADQALLDCPTRCSAQVEDGERLTLTATPTAPDVFVGWSGACTGKGPCALQPTADVSVTATFAAVPVRVPLKVSISGKGRVVSTPAGIACPGRCTTRVAGAVTLRATARSGWRFSAWKPACGTTSTCRLKVQQATAVRAVFVRKR